MKFLLQFLITIWILLMQHHILPAQDFSAGARNRALGNTCVADSNAWSLFGNPAGSAHIKKTTLLVSDEQLYGVQDIKSLSAGILIPVKKGFVAGLTFQRQGYQWFNDQQVGIHAANIIGLYRLSISFMLWQRTAGETYHQLYPLFNIGGTMSLNKSVQLGLHISNFTNTQNENQTLLLRIQGGMLYKLSNQLLLYTDLVKQSNSHIAFHSGLEYKIHPHFYVRSGMQLNPMRLNGGAGFENKRIHIDYSLSYQSPLGYRHQLSASIVLAKKP
jgi:hypothetical protein